MSGRSIVEYLNDHEKYRCGYCGSTDTNYSHGMWAHSLTVEDYQDLIDRGWRRSGKYVYKPTMDLTCCPQYTIKCDALDFKMSKSQKKAIKKCNHYFNEGKKTGGERPRPEATPSQGAFELPKRLPTDMTPGSEEPMEGDALRSNDSSTPMVTSLSAPTETISSAKPSPKAGLGADPSRPQCQKAKHRRREKWQQKQQTSPAAPQVKQTTEKSLNDLLKSICDDPVNKLETRLVRSNPRCKGFNDTFDESHAIYLKYQMLVHNDPREKPSVKQFSRFLVDSPLQIRLVRSSPPSKLFTQTQDESFKVYEKYQMKVHNDKSSDCDEDSYHGFLVQSPLTPHHRDGGFQDGFGSFHQHYLINGKIVAVGVVDILPKCVSSVYLYYDPDFFFLSLGTYTALQELSFTRYLHSIEPSIQHYYMGFYIHSCPKMLYKGQYHPSYLLCPVTYSWQAIEVCRPKLDSEKFCKLGDDAEEEQEVELRSVLVLYNRQAVPYPVYCMIKSNTAEDAEVKQYAGLVGKKCAARMLLYRS